MKVLDLYKNREKYIETQIERSRQKFGYCKVSMNDVLNYVIRIKKYNKLKMMGSLQTPLICLGTRNGREVDLFRLGIHHPLIAGLIAKTEFVRKGFHSVCDPLLFLGRSDAEAIDDNSVIGVEINSMAKREDIWIGSFDEMPKSWEEKFGVIYSNSFDHSQDPHKTAKEWIRIAKNNALLIFAFSDLAPTVSDPVGNIELADVLNLFPGELLYFSKAGSFCNYNEVIILLKKQ